MKVPMGRWMPVIMSTPMYRVNRPMAAKTALRSFSGTRFLSNRPVEAPAATVTVL